MGYVNCIRKVEGGGSDEWVRPSDWLSIPTIATGEEVVYALMSVYNVIGNFATVLCQGNYTVDWGDGNIENVSSNVKAEHSYSWADVGNVTSEGWRQALIKITPQAGANLTVVNFQQSHSAVGNGKNSQFVDIVMNIPNVSGESLYVANNTIVYHRSLQRVLIKEVGILTSLYIMFSYCYSLQSVPLFDTSGVNNMSYMFTYCYSLQSVPLFDTSEMKNAYQMFYNCYSLKSVPLFDTSSVTEMSSMFAYCYSLQSVPLFDTSSAKSGYWMFLFCYSLKSVPLFDTSEMIDAYQMFDYCYNIKTLPYFNMAKVTNAQYAFRNCNSLESISVNLPLATSSTQILTNNGNIQKCVLNGITIGFSVANCKMSATALNEMFTALGTASGAQTITITGNYGAATCDTSIATAKGFTIVS